MLLTGAHWFHLKSVCLKTKQPIPMGLLHQQILWSTTDTKGTATANTSCQCSPIHHISIIMSRVTSHDENVQPPLDVAYLRKPNKRKDTRIQVSCLVSSLKHLVGYCDIQEAGLYGHLIWSRRALMFFYFYIAHSESAGRNGHFVWQCCPVGKKFSIYLSFS